MFGLFKLAIFILIAMATGLAAVSIPVGELTVAERIHAWWDPDAAKEFVSERTGVGRRFARGQEAEDPADAIDDEDRAALKEILERPRR